ncbi:MAG: hypothetical protein ACXV2B_05635, partial [Halobacteriota archaeon]
MTLRQGVARWLSGHRGEVIVLATYVVLTVIFTYPAALSANSVPGGGQDAYLFMWNLWALKNAVFTHTSPLFTSYLFYPVGVSLVWSTTSFFNAALSIPLQLTWDLPHAYTFVWLLSFVLSGYGMFALVRYLGVSTKVAFVAGLIFMFCPFRFAHGLGHLNLMTTQWIPFFALFFLKTLREPKWSNPAIAGVFLVLAAFSDFQFVLYLVTFSLLATAYYFWRERRQLTSLTSFLKRGSFALVVFGAFTAPLLIPMLQELLHGSYMYSPYADYVRYSADLVAFFIPSPWHPLLGSHVLPLYQHFGPYAHETTMFVGYIGLVLSIVVVLKRRTHDVVFWALASGVFIVLSLGPVLQIYDSPTVPLPYAILWRLPVVSISRVPARWGIMIMLCVAVLSGFGLQYLVDRFRSPRRIASRENVLCLVFAGLILFEFLSAPYPVGSTSVPAFYKTMASDPESYAILEVPFNFNGTILYYQTIHHKPLVGGYVSREPPNARQFVEKQPSAHFLSLIQFMSNNVSVNASYFNPSALAQYNIRYVIVHQEHLTPHQVDLVTTMFN